MAPITSQEQISINRSGYDSLLKIWAEQDKRFQDSDTKGYSDFLKPR